MIQRQAIMSVKDTLTTGAIEGNVERVPLRNLSEVGRVSRIKRWRYEQEGHERCELRLTLSGPSWAFDILERALRADGPKLWLRHHVLQAIGRALGDDIVPFRIVGGVLTRKRDNSA